MGGGEFPLFFVSTSLSLALFSNLLVEFKNSVSSSLTGSVIICPIGKRQQLPLFFLCLRGAALGRRGGMFVFGFLTQVKVSYVNPCSICCWIPFPLGSLFSMGLGGLRLLGKLVLYLTSLAWLSEHCQ